MAATTYLRVKLTITPWQRVKLHLHWVSPKAIKVFDTKLEPQVEIKSYF